MIERKCLLLVDGTNLFVRAWSALSKQGLETRDGEGTWGVFGTLNTLTTMVRRFEPSHVLVVFDKGRSNKRLEIYPEYKANRDRKREKKKLERGGESPPDDFRPQLQTTLIFLEKMGVPYLRQDNVEADDIIAKAVTSFGHAFDKVVIVSADHDMLQLIRDNTIVVKPSLGVNKEEVYDRDWVLREWGLEPIRLPEIWALTGDSGDNIPGMVGTGVVKAKKLMEEYGSLENILASDNEKVQENLDNIKKAYSLIQLDGLDDIPFPPLGQLQFQPVEPDTQYSLPLLELFQAYEFINMEEKFLNGTLWKERSFGRTLSGKK